MLSPMIAYAGVISDAPRVTTILMNIVTFVLSIVGIVAILALGVAGIMYLFSSGDPSVVSQAKRYAWASITGIVIASAAFIIIQQVTKLFS